MRDMDPCPDWNPVPPVSPAVYQPLLPVALALMAGIAISAGWPDCPLFTPGMLAAALTGWALLYRVRRAGSWLVLLAVAMAGGWWHDWRAGPVVEIAPGDPLVKSVPVCLAGVLCSNPLWSPPPESGMAAERQRPVRTRFKLDVTGIARGGTSRPARGRIEVFVDGQVSGLVAGDAVRLAGNLERVRTPGNPGEFDMGRFLQARQIRCRMNIDHPDAIQIQPARGYPLVRLGGQLKLQLDELLWSWLSAENAPLASAMLLGNRDQLTRYDRQQFMLTGTAHLLAISGLHVGILAAIFFWLPRTGLIGRRSGLLLTVIFVAAYAWLVDFRPPVVRAAILVAVFCYCKWIGRDVFSFNSLALAALFVLVCRPAELFSTGAQLSFLAVTALVFARRWLQRPPPPVDPLDRLIEKTRPGWERLARRAAWRSWQAVLVSTIVWCAALPLVASRFHIVAPVALLANPLLLPPVALALVSGLGVLLFGSWLPPLALVCGWVCDGSLSLVQTVVHGCQSWSVGHFWTPGPGGLAVALFYAVLGGLVVFRPRGISCRLAVMALLGWLAVGWIVPFLIAQHQARHRQSLVCTVVDVGHGTCVLLELPGGGNLLYDCGSMGSPLRSARNASAVLWSRGITRLDAVIVSHADADHFNGLPELAERFRIGELVVSGRMARQADQPGIRWLLDSLTHRGTAVRRVSTDDELNPRGGTRIRILNPPARGQGPTDNSDSLVLCVETCGQRILLPGDLELTGLDALLARASLECDVVLAPHHGSPHSRPEDFVRWSRPRFVVVSSRLGANMPDPTVVRSDNDHWPRYFHTGIDGAVRFVADSTGRLSARSWRHHPW